MGSKMIRKLGEHKFELVSHEGRNLGIFPNKMRAMRHEREVEFFKYAEKHHLHLRNQK